MIKGYELMRRIEGEKKSAPRSNTFCTRDETREAHLPPRTGQPSGFAIISILAVRRLTFRDIEPAPRVSISWPEETTARRTFLDDFARYDNAQHIRSLPAAGSARQRE